MDTLGISFLWDELKSAGYRTLFAEDWPGAAIFKELTASSSAAKKAGTALIATLNAAVTKANVTDKCHRLQLSSINKAVELRGAQQYLRKQCLSLMNVVMIGVDSVSRLNMIRHLKRTRHFLLDRMQALDLEDYNKVGLNTFPNILPMMTGHAMKEFNRSVLKTQHLDTLHLGFLWEEFKNAGYRTLYAEDLPEISIFNYLKEGFKRPPAHYYNRPLEKAKEKNEELFGDWRHCFGTQPQDELILNYSLAFQRVFRDKPHFAFTFLTASTHEDVNGASQVDGYHARYLSSLVEEGLVNNTLLIFFSDHGIRWGPVRNTPQGGFEDSRPFMYLAFPSRFREEHPELMQRVQKNAARLVTPFDIHATLLDVLYRVPGVYRQKSSAENKGISLFDEQAGAALVASLNAAMTQANVTGKCHMLQLGKVTNLQQIGGAEHYMKKKYNVECIGL
nr:hypothetical protein BaRGS_033520 [Batillaria attramentaria]